MTNKYKMNMSCIKVKASTSGCERLELVLDSNFAPPPAVVEDAREEHDEYDHDALDELCRDLDERHRHQQWHDHFDPYGEGDVGHSASTCETDNRTPASLSRAGSGSGSLCEVKSSSTWSEDSSDGDSNLAKGGGDGESSEIDAMGAAATDMATAAGHRPPTARGGVLSFEASGNDGDAGCSTTRDRIVAKLRAEGCTTGLPVQEDDQDCINGGEGEVGDDHDEEEEEDTVVDDDEQQPTAMMKQCLSTAHSEDTSVESVGYKVSTSYSKESLRVNGNDLESDIENNNGNKNDDDDDDDDDDIVSSPQTLVNSPSSSPCAQKKDDDSCKIEGMLQAQARYNFKADRRQVTSSSCQRSDDEDDEDDVDNPQDDVNNGDGTPLNPYDPHQRECDDVSERPNDSPHVTKTANGDNNCGRLSATNTRPAPPLVPMRPPVPALSHQSVASGRSDVAIAPSPLAAHNHQRWQGDEPYEHGRQLHTRGVMKKRQELNRLMNSNHRQALQLKRTPQNGSSLGRRRGGKQHAQRLFIRPTNSNASNVSFATSGGNSNVALDGFVDSIKGRHSWKGSGGDKRWRSGMFLPIKWTSNFASRNFLARKKKSVVENKEREGRDAKVRHNSVGADSYENDDHDVEWQRLPTTDLQQLRQRPPLVATSPTNNDRTSMNCQFEGYNSRKDSGGDKSCRGGLFSPIKWTSNFASRNFLARKKKSVVENKEREGMDAKVRHNSVGADSCDNDDHDVEWQRLPTTDLQQLRQRPPLVTTSPMNNDRTLMNCQFEGYNHIRLPLEVLARSPRSPRSRPSPRADDRNMDRMTVDNAGDAGIYANVNPWASIAGRVPQSGEADTAIPCNTNNNVEPFPFTLNSDVMSSPPGQYDLNVGSGMPAFKWWIWKQPKSPIACDAVNSEKETTPGCSEAESRGRQQQGQQSHPEGDCTYFAFMCMLPNGVS